jgi:hypothetical protein
MTAAAPMALPPTQGQVQMTVAKTTDRRFRSARLTGVLRVGLTVLACWAFNACGLNPRPEGSAADKGEMPAPPMGGAGGASNSPGSSAGGALTGAGGSQNAGAGRPGARDGGADIVGQPDGGGVDGSSPDAGAEASDAIVVD